MSGDVQPRKRKDKKKKKDELSLEEPRGTAAALGEGDVFMHSYSEHGTGGHWCAKIIFFSLLAVLVTLIGLIILENRGLSELEANSVESRYSNILEGWLEDAPDDDHHDEHTLELKHHDDDEDVHYDSHDVDDHADEDEDEHADEDEDEHADDDEDEHADGDEDEQAEDDEDEHADDDEDEHADEDSDEDEETHDDDDEERNVEQDRQQDLEEADDEDEDDRRPYKYYTQEDEDEDETKKYGYDEEDEDEQETSQEQDDDVYEQNDENEDEDDKDREVESDEDEETNENDNDDDEENETREDEDEHDEHEEEDDEVEVEKIEAEASEEEPIAIGLPVLPEEDDDDNDKDQDDHDEGDDDGEEADDDEDSADGDFLETDVPPVVERVSAPAGKPFVEVDEDDDSTEIPPDTLEEEEEYEKQQEELKKEKEQSSHHIWLKLTVGAALLVATLSVLRRATAPRDEAEEDRVEREETPVVDRRMTLIPEQAAPPVVTKKEIEKLVVEEIVRRESPVLKARPVLKHESEEEVEDLEDVVEEEESEDEEPEKLEAPKKEADKELYSDEEEEVFVSKKEAPKAKELPKPEPEDEDPDDVEIIDEEQLEEELEEEEDDVSDVDDAELLSRLEAKYGRLPEPERFGQKHKDGGNSVEDAWPGEPADAYWRQQLDSAERELRQGAWSAAAARAGAGELAGSARARYVAAAALDRLAEARRDNALLSRAIAAYFHLLEMSASLSDKKLLEVARRTLDRIQFRGNYLKAEPVYRLLIRRFPNEPAYRNNMTISFLMANKNDLAENLLKETLARWPDDRIALAHYAFILKTSYKDKLEEAVELFQKALDGDKGPACEPRFYYHYGDALLLLGRFEEAHEVHKRGAKLGHFLSPAQRSLYNVPHLKSRPWWNINETPYTALATNLERRWKEILKEGQKAAGLYKEEEEGLRERGEWSQMDLFVRGQEVPGRCTLTPVTCAVVKAEPAAAGCRRGQVKFSSIAPGTHVRAHVGPTNCRLRMHLGLSNTKNTFLRVDQETRQWQEGKVLLFDDSFEHEVWHNGSGARLVLIVDVWHPAVSPRERRALPPI